MEKKESERVIIIRDRFFGNVVTSFKKSSKMPLANVLKLAESRIRAYRITFLKNVYSLTEEQIDLLDKGGEINLTSWAMVEVDGEPVKA